MRRRVYLNWRAGSYFGWGVPGQNLLLHWANDDRIEPFMGTPLAPEDFAMVDPLRMGRVLPAIARSNRLQAELAQRQYGRRLHDMVLIDSLGNRRQPPTDRIGVILAYNSGVVDLIAADNCVALMQQAPVVSVEGWGTAGWGESSVAEILDALERLYTDTARRKAIGLAGADWLLKNRRTWRCHASKLRDAILEAAAFPREPS